MLVSFATRCPPPEDSDVGALLGKAWLQNACGNTAYLAQAAGCVVMKAIFRRRFELE
jgi:hypothetical protein